MKMPDPDPSINYGQPEEKITGELVRNPEIDQDVDPLNMLLTENLPPEIDNERLYTDEFIRANENASRSLFLGFLGISLLGTSLFAWFILSKPKTNELEPLEPPSVVPSTPLSPEPNINQTQPIFPPTQIPTQSSPNLQQPQSPLVFPVTPVPPTTPTPAPQTLPEGPEPSSPSSSSTP